MSINTRNMPSLPSQNSPSFMSSPLQTISNYFKPHRAEALQRIRVNSFCFLLVAILSNLLPLPKLQTAIRTVASSSYHETWASDWMYKWCCITEVGLATIFAFNTLEGLYAVKYPRPPLASYSSPAKTKSIFQGSPTPQRPFKVLSPNTSPQPQKPFTLSASKSFSASTSNYPISPLSTPSRVLQYSTIPTSSTNTQTSSTSTMGFSTPSPIISAYRGKHLSGSVGHALDGSFLGRIVPEDVDEDY